MGVVVRMVGDLELRVYPRPHSSSFLGLPYRILNMKHKKELLWCLRVYRV